MRVLAAPPSRAVGRILQGHCRSDGIVPPVCAQQTAAWQTAAVPLPHPRRSNQRRRRPLQLLPNAASHKCAHAAASRRHIQISAVGGTCSCLLMSLAR